MAINMDDRTDDVYTATPATLANATDEEQPQHEYAPIPLADRAILEGICFIMARAKPQFSRLGRERLGSLIWLESVAGTLS